MAAIVHCFLFEFIPAHEKYEDIDLSDVIDRFKNYASIQLKCTKPDDSIQNMPAVIILNLMNFYGEQMKISFPSNNLKSFVKIIRQNTSNIHKRAQLILMVHLTHMNLHLPSVVLLFKKAETLFVYTSLTPQFEQWKSIVLKAINHPHINQLIRSLLRQIFGINVQLNNKATSEVQVHFVSFDCVDLRGFIGLNEFFINASHFLSKISQWKADAELLNLLLKIDLISLVLYQYTHLRLRQQVDDLNTNDFQLLNRSKLNLFNDQIDWFQSKDTIDLNYIKQFLNAIDDSTQKLDFIFSN